MSEEQLIELLRKAQKELRRYAEFYCQAGSFCGGCRGCEPPTEVLREIDKALGDERVYGRRQVAID